MVQNKTMHLQSLHDSIHTGDARLDVLVQDCGISIANALEIPQPYTEPSIFGLIQIALISDMAVIDSSTTYQWVSTRKT